MKNGIVLTSTLHDPRGSLYQTIIPTLDVVKHTYTGWVVNVTPQTDPRVQALLREKYVVVTVTDHNLNDSRDPIERDHLAALRNGLSVANDRKAKGLQYVDGDRILMAGAHYPHELAQMGQDVSTALDKYGYVGLPRSDRAFASHHMALTLTEEPVIDLYTEAYGIRTDPGSTAHAMDLAVAEHIVTRSPALEPVSFPHPKWIYLASETGVTTGIVATDNVLKFETPEQQRAQIEGLYGRNIGDYDDLIHKGHLVNELPEKISAAEWKLRLGTQDQWLMFLRNHMPRSAEGRRGGLEVGIDRALAGVMSARELLTREFIGGRGAARR